MTIIEKKETLKMYSRNLMKNTTKNKNSSY